MTMIGTKKLIEMTKKWRRLVAIRRKRLSLPIRSSLGDQADDNGCRTSSTRAEKGHFVVYTADSIRFVLPLTYLNSVMFREPLRLAEEEFGLPSNGPLTLPFDAAFFEYVISLIHRNVADNILEKALITSIATGRCLSSNLYLHQGQQNYPQSVIYGF